MMKKLIVIPDSFKGTLSSSEICGVIGEKAEKIFPGCQVAALPVADGGEGTVDCFLQAMEGEKVSLTVTGPWFEPVESFYGRFGETAVIEMAAAAGLPMVGERKDPSRTTTYGVGELIRHAIEQGAREIVLGMGGSCTNDGGCGCAAALGVEFLDEQGNAFTPIGATLSKIKAIRLEKAAKLLDGIHVTAMCDVENPMYGPTGAACIFGPQKGADETMVSFLDEQVKSLAAKLETDLGCTGLAELEGSGAAGAFGAGAVAFLNAELKSGIETVLDFVEFEEKLQGADAVFTGEGRFDSQSLHGKVISGIAKRMQGSGIPLYVLAGDLTEDVPEAYDCGITALFSINRGAVPFEIARKHSRENLAYVAENIFRTIKAGNIR
jgi:glycerate kinase